MDSPCSSVVSEQVGLKRIDACERDIGSIRALYTPPSRAQNLRGEAFSAEPKLVVYCPAYANCETGGGIGGCYHSTPSREHRARHATGR